MRNLIGSLIIMLMAALAQAQTAPGEAPPPSERHRAAQGLVAAAIQAQAQGDTQAALRYLEQGYRIYPSPRSLYNLGVIQWTQARTIEGADLYRRYLQELGPEIDPERRREVESALSRPRPPAGELAVSGEPGALVLLDERLVGVLPLSLPLLCAPGPHRVRIEKGGRQAEAAEVHVAINELRRVPLLLPQQMDPLGAGDAVPPKREDRPASVRLPVPPTPLQREPVRLARPPWQLVTGTLIMAAGLGLGALGASALSIDGLCTRPDPTPPQQACPSGKIYDTRLAGGGMLSAGLAVAIGGTVVVALPGRKQRVDIAAGWQGQGPGLRLTTAF